MKNHLSTWRASRALQLAAAAVIAATAFLLSADDAGAQVSINKTDIEVSNEGVADANTGRNTGVGNDSVNESSTRQTEDELEDGVIFNESEEIEESEGEASIKTGSATARGNTAVNVIVQAVATGEEAEALIASAIGTPYGPTAASPLVPRDEAGSDAEEAPDPTESTGTVEDPEAEDAGAGAESEEGDTSSAATEPEAASSGGESPVTSLPLSGSAAADAGTPAVPALATEPLDNTVLGAVSGAGPPGLTVTAQDVDVENLGEASATTGENTVVDGDVLTGNATATGNTSENIASQLTAALGDQNLVDQAIEISNEGVGTADTGENEVEGGELETGDSDAAGSISATAASQLAVAAGDQNLVDQAIDASNEGDATAETGENAVEDGEVATGDATATGNWSGTALGQRVVIPASEGQDFVDQSLEAANEGDALADTGENTAVAGEDGEVAILTGEALAIGNRASTAASQESV